MTISLFNAEVLDGFHIIISDTIYHEIRSKTSNTWRPLSFIKTHSSSRRSVALFCCERAGSHLVTSFKKFLKILGRCPAHETASDKDFTLLTPSRTETKKVWRRRERVPKKSPICATTVAKRQVLHRDRDSNSQ